MEDVVSNAAAQPAATSLAASNNTPGKLTVPVVSGLGPARLALLRVSGWNQAVGLSCLRLGGLFWTLVVGGIQILAVLGLGSRGSWLASGPGCAAPSAGGS